MTGAAIAAVGASVLLLLLISQPWLAHEVEPAAGLIGAGILMISLGSGLRKRSAVSRWLTSLAAALGFFKFPLGAMAGGAAPGLLWNRGARRLFQIPAVGQAAPQFGLRRMWPRITAITILLSVLFAMAIGWW